MIISLPERRAVSAIEVSFMTLPRGSRLVCSVSQLIIITCVDIADNYDSSVINKNGYTTHKVILNCE